jgi:hypothetical protein
MTEKKLWLSKESLPSQDRFRKLTDEMLRYKDNQINLYNFWLREVNSLEVLNRVRQTTMSDFLLPEGADMSIEDGSGYYPNVEMLANDSEISGVSLTIWNHTHDEYKEVPKKSNNFTETGRVYWQRQIELIFWYGDTQNSRNQSLSMINESPNLGELPNLVRDVHASLYAEQGYEGHNQKWGNFRSEEEANKFLDIAEELFNTWKNQNPQRVEKVLSK